MMVSEPMSDERLAEIRAMLDGFQYGTLTITSVTPEQAVEAYNAHHGARWAISDLLAEVERLRAREAVLMEIAQAVADAGAQFNYGHDTTLLILCPGDDAESIRDKARALLAASPEPPDATTAE